MIQQKLVNKIYLNFPELFIIGKYVKIRFKNKGSPGLDKLRMCVRDILEIINFTNCSTLIFFKKYMLTNTSSVS